MNLFDECAYESLKAKPDYKVFQRKWNEKSKFGAGISGLMLFIAVFMACFDFPIAFLFIGLTGALLLKFLKNLLDIKRSVPPREVFYGKVLEIRLHKTSKRNPSGYVLNYTEYEHMIYYDGWEYSAYCADSYINGTEKEYPVGTKVICFTADAGRYFIKL